MIYSKLAHKDPLMGPKIWTSYTGGVYTEVEICSEGALNLWSYWTDVLYII